jgi:hypothetical protein
VSDDDFARIAIAQRFAEAPSLDPSGTSWLPLPFWIYGTAFATFGNGLGVARVVAVALGILAALLVWLAARWFGAGRVGALAAGLLAALFPWSVWLGAAPLPEVLTAGLLSLGVAGLGSDSFPRRLVAGAAVGAACFCRYEAWPIAVAFALFSALDARRTAERRWLAGAGLALAPILAWLAHGVARHGDALFFWKRVAGYRDALGGSAPLAERLFAVPLAWVREEPGLLLLAVAALAITRPASRYRRPVLSALALFAFLLAGEIGGGGPTHHAARALLPVWYLACVVAGDALGRKLTGQRDQSAAWLLLPVPLLAASWFVHGSVPHHFPDRRAAVAIGTSARELGAPALLIDTPDYSHLAVAAAYGRPGKALPVDDRDPRKPRSEDIFASRTALEAALNRHPRTWLVTSRAHQVAATNAGSVRAQNSDYLLVEPSP